MKTFEELISQRGREAIILCRGSFDPKAGRPDHAANSIIGAVKGGSWVLIVGEEGGSLGESVNHFLIERHPLPARAQAADTSLANSCPFDQVFIPPVEALGKKDAVILALSTSGTPPSI